MAMMPRWKFLEFSAPSCWLLLAVLVWCLLLVDTRQPRFGGRKARCARAAIIANHYTTASPPQSALAPFPALPLLLKVSSRNVLVLMAGAVPECVT
ncbi:hypothetical protein QBC45DRAFT_398899 [Copromyces sp. CBS 386.78]|nr:hypothetical protein QBC45DRAFT_398899 [Copromyces sp. CBS 386.78]